VPIGEVGVDWEITDRALGVKTLYRAKWRTYTALWEGRREGIVESHVRDLIRLARKFEWDFVVIPVLFNPLVPIHLRRHTWQIFDLVAAGVFVAAAFALRSTPGARKATGPQ
jgi:hypothetical protein